MIDVARGRLEGVAASTTVLNGLVHSPTSPLVDIRRACLRIAPSEATVLLTGETGTGKEVFARMIHAQSARARRAYVPVNCGAIPEALLESELFGYVRGAFTGAVSPRRGRVACAEGGTLFLDEVGELSLALQVKLLRLLQERVYEPVGSSESVHADFRLIAATNRNLAQEVRAGRFRSDLYYRLHVCPVELPPVRERPGDVRPLFEHFWSQRGEKRVVAPEVMRCLEAYAWPGNVRELENLVERLSVCTEGTSIRVSDLPPAVRNEPSPVRLVDLERELLVGDLAASEPPLALEEPESAPLRIDTGSLESLMHEITQVAPEPVTVDASLPLPIDLPTLLRSLETAYIDKALAQTGGNRKEASKLLGMGRTTLVEKLRRRNTDASSP
jgi:sigma-54 dependent transcriptional regulator, flagellar regulatory protein